MLPSNAISHLLKRRVIPFAISQLFASGEVGIDYDMSQLTQEKLQWRRNLILWSEQFDNAAWGKTATTIVADAIAGPDGVVNADKIVETTANNGHSITQGAVGYPVGNWIVSVKLKKGERGFAFVGFNGGGVASFVTVNLTTGAVSNAVSGQLYSSAIDLGNGWWHVMMSSTTINTSSVNFDVRTSVDGLWANRVYTGDGTSGIYIVGAQLEFSPSQTIPSSYQKITDFNTEFMTAFPNHTLFQDNAGSLPVTAVEQTLGLWLDNRFGGLRLPVTTVLNGNFDGGTTGWGTVNGPVFTVTNGQATVANGSAVEAGIIQFGTLTVGKTYEVLVDKIASTIAAGRVSFGGNSYALAIGANRFIAIATTANFGIYTNSATTGASVTVDNVVVREIPGNHAIQATTANRPIATARINKCLNFSTAPVDTTGISFGNNTGSGAVLTIVDDTAALSAAGLLPLVPSGKVYKLDNTAGTDFAYADISGLSGAATIHTASSYVRGSGTGGMTGNDTNYGPTGGALSASYTRLQTTAPAISATTRLRFRAGVGGIIYFILNQFEENTTASRHQAVYGSTMYDISNFLVKAKFNGTNTGMICQSIDMSSTDKLTIVAGLRRLADTSGILVEYSANSGTNTGTFGLFTPTSNGSILFRSAGTTPRDFSTGVSAYNAPINLIATLQSDISGASRTSRINSVTLDTSSLSLGTGNFGNYTLYIGSRGGTSNYFTGELQRLIIRGRTSTSDQIVATEQIINKQMGGIY